MHAVSLHAFCTTCILYRQGVHGHVLLVPQNTEYNFGLFMSTTFAAVISTK